MQMRRASATLVCALALLAGCGTTSPTSPAPSGSAGPSASPRPPSPPPSPVLTPVRVAISAVSWQDNEPPGPVNNDHPVLHATADGQGTYADPITASLPTGADRTYPPGTRFYLPSLKRYLIAEDYGQPPAPAGDDTALNVWIDGRDGTKAQTDACEDAVTGSGTTTADVNPPPNLPVLAGPIFANHTCNLPPSAG